MDHLIVLLKNPIHGKAKTRVAARVGEEAALTVYNELLAHLKEFLSTLESINIHLFFSDSITDTGIFSDQFEHHLQSGADLGQRMLNAAKTVKAIDNHAKIVIIGSDCPYICKEHINEAFNSLNSYNITFGPALDGGYYLIGFQEVTADLFNNITWSTEHVLADSLSTASKCNLTYALMSMLSDVDTYDDYLTWKNSNISENDSLSC